MSYKKPSIVHLGNQRLSKSEARLLDAMKKETLLVSNDYVIESDIELPKEVLADASSNDVEVTIPAASEDNKGLSVTFLSNGAGTLSIVDSDGNSVAAGSPGDYLYKIISTGTAWRVFEY